MKECWNPDPKKRPTATDIGLKIYRLWLDEGKNPCKIVKSQDIGPITNNPGAIYKSRHLSKMVKSAESTRTLGFNNTIKKLNYLKIKILSFKFDIDENVNSIGFNSDYVTREIEFDI
uniref:Serine-threonine/tyrosine-protein kinase catalytic domain-containing protein n=1 Tax=Rhizophagus irregularis (strain DAOM 181602 / DAOM 197198 / MUCL 43194) TaxID=747089 RepID=U9UML4_RHIID